MQYPDDATLVARGKYATLSKERYAQIERVQKIAKTIMHHANPLLQDCQEQPPVDGSHLKALEDCLRNAQNARERIVELCAGMDELKPTAWPQ